MRFKKIHSKEVINHGDKISKWGVEILENSFDVKKYCWKPYSRCKEIIVVFILRINYRVWYIIYIKLTNTLTKFDPTFHQNPMSSAIEQLIEKPTTWFDMQNKLIGFYMRHKTQKFLNFRWTLAQNGSNLKKKDRVQSNSTYVLQIFL